MIKQLLTPYSYSLDEQDCITAANNNWYSQKNCIKDLQALLHAHFNARQADKCCYCGLKYNRTGRGEIDHIAPQGDHPQFSYTPKNLAKACQLCNSSTLKHDFNTIVTANADYEDCIFNIVHPYLDDHDWHYSWKYGRLNVVISVNNNSDRARQSIKLFQLDSENRTRARATERNQELRERRYQIQDAVKDRIKRVLTFRW